MSEYAAGHELTAAQAAGIWAKYAGNPHPHAACVADFGGKVGDGHAFCARVEMMAAGTTPAERAAKKMAIDSIHAIEGVEIFKAGTHNGDAYTETDLQAMVDAFGLLDFKPPLKAGHSSDKKGMPALGWISNLRKVGSTLLADFTDLPKLVYEAIKDKRYNTVSAEIYWNLERGAKKFSRALKAVAILGAEIPAVAGLKPLHEMFDASDTTVVRYAADVDLRFSTQEVDMTKEEVSALLDEKLADAAKKAEAKAEADKAEMVKKHEADLATAKKEAEDKYAKLLEAKGGADLKAVLKDIEDATSQAKVAELSAELKAKTDLAEAERKARESAEARAKAEGEKVAKLEEEQRRSQVDSVAASCRIPGMRAFIAQYCDLATRTKETAYVQDDKGSKSPALEQAAVFIKYVNENAARLFTVVSREDPTGKNEADVGQEVDKRAKKYALENKVSYSAAMKAVLDADPTLKHEYAVASRRA